MKKYIRRYLLEIGECNTNSPFVSYSIPNNIRRCKKMVKDVDLELRPMTIKQKTFTKKHDWF